MSKLTKIVSLFDEQTATRANTGYAFPNYAIPWLFTSGNYDGTLEIYFEAVLSVTSGYTAYAELYGASSVSGSEVNTTATTPTRVRSGDLASALSDGQDYRVRIKSSSASGTATLYACRLIIVQTGTITKTETIIEFGSNKTGSDTSYVLDANKGFWDYVSAEWDGTIAAYFEAYLSIQNASATAYAQLSTSGGSAVSGSEITNGSTADTRIRSGNIYANLVGGNEYTVQCKTSNGSYQWRCRSARLVIVQTGTPTKTCSYYPLQPTYLIANTLTTYPGLTYWDTSKWDVASRSEYFEITMQNWPSQTATAYLNDGVADVSTLTETSGNRVHQRSSALSLITGREHNLKLDSTSGYTSHYMSYLVVVATITSGGMQYNQSISGVATPTGALIKQDQTTIAGVLSVIGALARLVSRSLNGATTLTGAFVRQARKALGGAIAPAGTLAQQGLKVIIGAITPIGALIRSTPRAFSGTISLAGALETIKTKMVSLAGAVTPSALLSKLISTSKTGATNPAGALIRNTAHGLSGAISPSGLLSAIRAVLRSLTGAVSASGTLARQGGKVLSGSISSNAALMRVTGKITTGATSIAGALASIKTRLLSIVGTLSTSGNMTRQTTHQLTALLSTSGSVVKHVGKRLVGMLQATASLVGQLLGITTTTPASRTYRVPAEARTWTVVAEGRSVMVVLEGRTLEV